jgi:SAM-dependent methyltransferase
MKQVRVNIDAGLATLPDFINIDVLGKGEHTVNFDKEKLPFEDDSVDVIFSYHALEHISDYLSAVAEIHRVLKHGGRLLLGLPYVSLTEYHLINPYHLHNFNEHSFDFFDADKFADLSVDKPVLFKKQFHRLHYLGLFKYLPNGLKNWSRRHLLNVVQKMDIGLIAIKEPNVPLNYVSQETMLQEFQQYFDERVPY